MRKLVENSTVRIFAINEEGEEYLSTIQDTWPNGVPFANDEEAEGWADAAIEAATNPESEFLAGISPEKPLIPRPVEEEETLEEDVTVVEPEAIEE